MDIVNAPSTSKASGSSANRTSSQSNNKTSRPPFDREAGPSMDRVAGPSTNSASGSSTNQTPCQPNNRTAYFSVNSEEGPSTNSASGSSTNQKPCQPNNRTDFSINSEAGPSTSREAGPSTSNVITHTRNPSHDIPVCWRIENALTFTEEVLKSPLLKGQGCKTKINIFLKFKESKSRKFTVVSIGFQRTDKLRVTFLLTYDLRLENSTGDVYMHNTSEVKCEKHMDHYHCFNAKFAKNSSNSNDFQANSLDSSILKDLNAKGLAVLDESQQVLYLLPDDVLLVKGHVTVIGCCTKTRTNWELREQAPLQRYSKAHVALQRDFRKAFEKSMYYDVELLVDGQIYMAHKFVLAARSPKLQMTLEQYTDEESVTEKTRFGINGVSASVFEVLLHFLYTGILGEIDEFDTKISIYEAAHHFEIDSLKEECAKMILLDISQDNAFELLEFADSHKDSILKDGATSFIMENFEEVNKTDEWDTFINSHTILAAELLKQYSPRKRRK